MNCLTPVGVLKLYKHNIIFYFFRLQMANDIGFGEWNFSGFGFINVYREKLPWREQQDDVDEIPAAHLHASE